MKLALFATAGATEVGGLQAFLGRWLPEVTIERKFPAALRRRRRPSELDPSSGPGRTGADLLREVERRIAAYGLDDADAVLIVDDADCRFGCQERTDLQAFQDQVVQRMRTAAARDDLPVFLLLASPEIESWFLHDLDNGFGHPQFLREHYEQETTATTVARALSDSGVLRPDYGWEAFGCPPTESSCSRKLSAEVAAVLDALPGRRGSYSKKMDGGAMLRRLDPQRIAERCPLYAAGALASLRTSAASEER